MGIIWALLKNFDQPTAHGGFLNVVKLLVKNNASIDIQDHDGWNAFDYSLANSHFEVADYLIDNGA